MKILFGTALILALVFSCSNTSSISEETVNDEWVPAIELMGMGYGRFGLQISRQLDEIRPHIDKLIIRAIRLQDSVNVYLSVLSGRDAEGRIRFISGEPSLPAGVSYRLSVTLRYTNGTERRSNSIDALMPSTSGTVLSSLKIPDSWEGRSLGSLAMLDSLICRVYNNQAFIYNTIDGSIEVGQLDFGDLPDRFNSVVLLGILNEKFIFFDRGFLNRYIARFIAYDPITKNSTQLFDIDDPNRLEFVAINDSAIFAYDRRFTEDKPEAQFRIYNPETGVNIRNYPYLDTEDQLFNGYFTLVGEEVWKLATDLFSNKLQHISPSNGNIISEYEIPVFLPYHLLFKDNNFWTLEENQVSQYSSNLVRFLPGE